MLMNSGEYLDLVQSIKQEIQSAQYRAALNVNRELICLYYDIGAAINEHKTWGNKLLRTLLQTLGWHSRKQKGIRCEISNTWRNLRRPIRTGNLCRQCLHK
jgi:hypothetical protein